MMETDVRFARREDLDASHEKGAEVWDFQHGERIFARAEVFRGEEQWGVRLSDKAPELEDADLVRIVSRFLVFGVSCRADTVDCVLGRTHEHHSLVRVGATYV